jgi:hypothetical protein
VPSNQSEFDRLVDDFGERQPFLSAADVRVRHARVLIVLCIPVLSPTARLRFHCCLCSCCRCSVSHVLTCNVPIFSSSCGGCVAQIRDQVRRALVGAAASASSHPTPRQIEAHIGELMAALQRYDPAHRRNSESRSVVSLHPDRSTALAGTVSMLEFERALLALGVRVNAHDIAEVVTDLGIERDGRVTYAGTSRTTLLVEPPLCRLLALCASRMRVF